MQYSARFETDVPVLAPEDQRNHKVCFTFLYVIPVEACVGNRSLIMMLHKQNSGHGGSYGMLSVLIVSTSSRTVRKAQDRSCFPIWSCPAPMTSPIYSYSYRVVTGVVTDNITPIILFLKSILCSKGLFIHPVLYAICSPL
jgi:hypothetical protein